MPFSLRCHHYIYKGQAKTSICLCVPLSLYTGPFSVIKGLRNHTSFFHSCLMPALCTWQSHWPLCLGFEDVEWWKGGRQTLLTPSPTGESTEPDLVSLAIASSVSTHILLRAVLWSASRGGAYAHPSHYTMTFDPCGVLPGHSSVQLWVEDISCWVIFQQPIWDSSLGRCREECN